MFETLQNIVSKKKIILNKKKGKFVIKRKENSCVFDCSRGVLVVKGDESFVIAGNISFNLQGRLP